MYVLTNSEYRYISHLIFAHLLIEYFSNFLTTIQFWNKPDPVTWYVTKIGAVQTMDNMHNSNINNFV